MSSTYKEQHSAILEAIVVFAGRIHQHASDYLQREQLVSRAFLQYLLSVVSGALAVLLIILFVGIFVRIFCCVYICGVFCVYFL